MDLSDVDFSGLYPAQDPVVVTGDVRNTAGMLLLQFTAGTVLRSVCDRCLKRFDNPKSVRCEARAGRISALRSTPDHGPSYNTPGEAVALPYYLLLSRSITHAQRMTIMRYDGKKTGQSAFNGCEYRF